jgi:hypothetical protein
MVPLTGSRQDCLKALRAPAPGVLTAGIALEVLRVEVVPGGRHEP